MASETYTLCHWWRSFITMTMGALRGNNNVPVTLIGSQQDKKVIDAEIIRAAVDNQGLY